MHRLNRRRALALSAAAGVAVAAVVVALTVGGSTPSSSTKQAEGPSGLEAHPAKQLPHATLQLFNGTSVSFADYRGTPLVINFFASWCRPCLSELPEFERVHQRYQDRVGFLGLNLQDAKSDAQRIIDQTGITYDVAADPDGTLFQALGGIGMPTTILVDGRGHIVAFFNGEISGDELDAAIRHKLLA